MEHQDLPAKTPARQFKAIGIVTQRITAFRPWLLHPIGREASQISCAFAVVKEQFKMPKERISKYFAPGTPAQKIEDTIIKALELYRKRQRSLER